ncbi:unnamed protein product [Lampetra fluviatilis]
MVLSLVSKQGVGSRGATQTLRQASQTFVQSVRRRVALRGCALERLSDDLEDAERDAGGELGGNRNASPRLTCQAALVEY